MSNIDKYNKEKSFSYALGVFPSFEAINFAQNECIKLIISEEASGDGVQNLLDLCDKKRIRIERAPKLLQKISSKKNTHVAMQFKKLNRELDSNSNHIVLYNIMDAGNLGTIMRSALGFGFTDIAIIRPATDMYEPQTVRASMGAIFRLRCVEFNTFKEYTDKYNRDIYPFMLSAKESLSTIVNEIGSNPYSLIFGNEGSGLPDEFINIGRPCKILHSNNIDSLNLSIAVSIAMQRFTEINFEE